MVLCIGNLCLNSFPICSCGTRIVHPRMTTSGTEPIRRQTSMTVILPESMKLHVGVNSNGDVDVGEINLSEMDPEDIRVSVTYHHHILYRFSITIESGISMIGNSMACVNLK